MSPPELLFPDEKEEKEKILLFPEDKEKILLFPEDEEPAPGPFTYQEDLPAIPTDPRDTRFFSVLSRTIDELQASGWAGVRVLGETFDSERLIDVGNRGIAVNERQIAKHGRPLGVEEVEDWEDTFTFIKQGIAQVMPSIAVSLPTAVLGARGGAATGAAIGSVVPGLGTALGGTVGGFLGGALGAFLPSFILSTGEIDREMKARAGEGFEDPGTAMTGGMMVAALDVASIAVGLKPLLPVLLRKTTLKKVTDKLIAEGVEKSVAKAAVGQALVASIMEGTTEAGQEGIEDFMAEVATEISGEEGQLQSALLNAFALGAIGGASMGAVSGVISQGRTNALKQNEREISEQLEIIEKEVQEQVNVEGKTWEQMDLEQLVEEANSKYITLERTKEGKVTETEESLIKKLTTSEVTTTRMMRMKNYLFEEFGNLAPLELIARDKLRAELEAMVDEKTWKDLNKEQLIEEAVSKDIPLERNKKGEVIETEESLITALANNGINELIQIAEGAVLRKEGESDIPRIQALKGAIRNMPVDMLINEILDRYITDNRSDAGNRTSILFRAFQTQEYQGRLELLEKEKRQSLMEQFKARGLKAIKVSKKGKIIEKKRPTNKEMARMIMDHDVFLQLHRERQENYYEGKGYNRTKFLPFGKGRYRKKIEKEGPSMKWNVITVTPQNMEEQLQLGEGTTWEQVVEKELSDAGSAVEVTYTVDKNPLHKVVPEDTPNTRKEGGQTFERRDVVTDEEGNLVGGTGLFNTYEGFKNQKRKNVTVSKIKLEMNPDIPIQSDPVGGILGSLRHWFAPSGPLGWTGFMAKRQRIANIRKMNQAINQIAKKADMALAHAVAEGEYANLELGQEALRRALIAATPRFERKKDAPRDEKGKVIGPSETSELEKELAEKLQELAVLKATIAEQEIMNPEDIGLLEDDASKETFKQLNKHQKKLIVDKIILEGDILELQYILGGEKARLTPAQAANLYLRPSLREPFIEIRSFIDMMSERLLRELPHELLFSKKNKNGKALHEVIRENLGSYMTRSYKIFEAGDFYDPTSWWQRNLPTKSGKELRKNIAAVENMLMERGFTRDEAEAETRKIAAGMGGETPFTDFSSMNILGRGRSPEEGEISETGFDPLVKDVLLQRQRIPKPIRALMGEVTSPTEAAAVTTARLSSLLENNRFWQTLAMINEDPGQRLFSPVKVSLTETGKNVGWLGKDKGFTYRVGGEGYNPFYGMYTTRGVAEAIGEMGKVANLFTSGVNHSIWRNLVLTPKAWTQLGKIVLSPAAQVRNFLSAALFVVGNGHFIGIGKNFGEAVRVVGNELFEGGVDSQGRPIGTREKAQRTYNRLLELGVLNTSVRLGDVLSTFRLAGSGMFQEAGDFTAVLGNPFKKYYKRAEQFYTAADDFWKIIAFGSELTSVKERFATEADYAQMIEFSRKLGMQETLNKNDFTKAREELAAFYVRQTVPNYDYVGGFADILRSGAGAPFGNFIAFPTELVRTSANIISLSFIELGSNDWKTQKRGFTRLSGYGLAAYGIGAAAQAIGKALSDIDDEDLEKARYFLPDWAKHNLLIPIEKKSSEEGGGFDYIDGSYILVYDDLSRLPFTVMREYEEGREEGRTIEEALSIAMSRTMGNFMEPFMEPSIFHQALLDVLQNRNSNTGKEIFNTARREALPLRGAGEEAVTKLKYFWDRTQPGIASGMEKVLQAGQEGEFAYDRFGSKQELGDAWSSFFGIKVNRLNPTSSLNFSITDLLNMRRDAKKIFAREAYRQGAVTEEELLEAFLEMQKANFFVNQAIYNTFEAAKQLDADPKELKIVKNKRFPNKTERRAVIDKGKNFAIKPTTSLQEPFEEQTKRIERIEGIPSVRHWPKNGLKEIYKYFKDLPLPSDYQSELVREEEADLYE